MSAIEDKIRSICDESPGQMSYDERLFIFNTISSTNCKNLLVFGAGNDSELWSMCSKYTLILENDDEWLSNISSKFKNTQGLEFNKVNYNMFRTEQECLDAIKHDSVSKLTVDVCDMFLKKKWDAIIVDSPTGWRECNEYYRGGSIKLASNLAEDRCHIFIHDCNRRVETAAISKFLLGTNEQTIDRTRYILK